MKTVMYIDGDTAFKDDMNAICQAFDSKLLYVSSIQQAKVVALSAIPAIIVAEVDVEDGDGINLCQELRNDMAFTKTAIVLVSSKAEPYIQVLAFEAGADDYMVKPLHKRLVQARLKSIMRRIAEPLPQQKSQELKINREKFLVEYKGREIDLPRKEFEILALLVNNKGVVYNRDRIKQEVWVNEGKGVNSRTVDVHIKNIREMIGPKFIKTVKGVGYKYAG